MTIPERVTRCLDRGYVRQVDRMGSDLAIVRSARVSYDADWRADPNVSQDAKLIHYLWEHGHTTPFEAVTVTFEIKAPIFVFRQWHRHRTQSYNEVSARYTELPDEFYTPDVNDIGVQSKGHKQARDSSVVAHSAEEVEYYHRACQSAFDTYHTLLSWQWPRELARMVLPLSTYSRMFATANLANWFRFVELRDHPHAQMEIRVYAKAIMDFLFQVTPVACGAFEARRIRESDL